MVVRYPLISRIAFLPSEDNSVLGIDPDAVIPGEITFQGLEAVSRGNPKIANSASRIMPAHPWLEAHFHEC